MDRILLAHGSGGKLSHNLIEEIFLNAFRNSFLEPLNDSAILNSPKSKLAFTTDSYVVSPIFFPGGDIGKLSVCGTINDLAVSGAEPLYMSASFIIEEGFPLDELERIVISMADTAKNAGVKVVTGDTKVVERGKADKIFINTAGIGVIRDGVELSPAFIEPGDAIIVSGSMGDHGVAILKERGIVDMEVSIESDCAPLNSLVKDINLNTSGIKAMRDPTRGGLITTLNELSKSSGRGFLIEEKKVPVKEDVRAVCEILGFDPLYLANEGKLICITKGTKADKVLRVMRKNPLGKDAEIIGRVLSDSCSKVILETIVGNKRVVEMMTGEQLPRIC